jgi:lipid-A-disaccharide synthase
MEAAGQQRVVRAEDVAVMGVTEILLHIPRIYASYRRLVASIRRNRPDVAVLIDFPDVNFRLAKHLSRAGVPVVWFVSPQLWAWKRRRLQWVQERVDRMMVIFPFEESFYRERGVEAEFVGHPLAELPLPTVSRDEYAARHNLDPTKIWIAILPGSRWKEIRANMPALHELVVTDLMNTAAANTVFDGERLTEDPDPAAHTRFEFLLPVASTIDPTRLRAYLEELNAEHLKYFGPEASKLRLTLVLDAAEALLHARASVVASGTATVLAALIGNPFVVVYRVSSLSYALLRKLVRYPDEFANMPGPDGDPPISMVNLIAQERIVPELIQRHFTAEGVAEALMPLLLEGPERTRQIANLARVREALEGRAASHAGQEHEADRDNERGSGLNSAIGRVADAAVALLTGPAEVSPGSENLRLKD